MQVMRNAIRCMVYWSHFPVWGQNAKWVVYGTGLHSRMALVATQMIVKGMPIRAAYVIIIIINNNNNNIIINNK